MTPESSVLGGNDALRMTLKDLLRSNGTVMVISTCLPNMIGDDCEKVISDLEAEYPDSRILFVDSNRVDSGFDAHIEVIRALTGLIDTKVARSDAFVNVIDDNFISFNKGDNRKYLAMLASELGMMCGPGFLSDCSVDEIVSMRRYGTAVLCEDTRDNRTLKEMLQDKGITFMDRTLPRGFGETEDWIRELSATESVAEKVISKID
jgi:nitrogenase molybdenum-iron protein alpha/beta subunit